MYEGFSKLVENISNFMYSYLLIILLLVVGLYFTFRTKFIQARLLGESLRLVTEKKRDKDGGNYGGPATSKVPLICGISFCNIEEKWSDEEYARFFREV